ncbi:MAG: histidinol dehydrogenase [Oscillospiraceae bacterium]|jgi:histidinol dehydrogenase|nr:histidinol dehydrogenase [Oscillospiraceae bacterium]
MIKTIIANGEREWAFLGEARARGLETGKEAEETVTKILADVRERRDTALFDYTEKFDGAKLSSLEVKAEEIEMAASVCASEFMAALTRASENIRRYHACQIRQDNIQFRENGVTMGWRVLPLGRVGVYVPGGTAAYPSSVLMNAIPAKIAGVKEIIMVTPPGKDGKVNPAILAAARVAGVDRIFRVGGAQAIAALAYGTQTIPQVDKIIGPGNIYVATAKKLVFGQTDIDMIAGPSEILILADQTANPAFLAADLMSQAEHDPLASSVLVTDSAELAEQVKIELARQVQNLSRREIIEKSLAVYGAAIVTGDMDSAMEIANRIAPEHLEICAGNPMELLHKAKNAASVFVGHYTPEPLGDYWAGPNHVLPTSGTARFFSPLSVDSFVKKSSFLCYTREALKDAAPDVLTLAAAEGLTAHANAVGIRMEN